MCRLRLCQLLHIAVVFVQIRSLHGQTAVLHGYPDLQQRIEINDLAKNPKQWSLYIRAIDAIQHHPPHSTPFTWYQIGGIHGKRYGPWDNVTTNFTGDIIGYCHHGDILFATFHRVYLLALENSIWDVAQQLAKEYKTSQDEWKTAASQLRIPYWDWAINPVPTFIQPDQIEVEFPDGKKSIKNPLNGYTYQEIIRDSHGNVTDTLGKRTKRGDKYVAEVDDSRPSWKEQVCDFLHMNKHADQRGKHMSEEMWAKVEAEQEQTFSGLESVHGDVHTIAGGDPVNGVTGDMGDLDRAGYDPMFYLLHANVDRLFALWQLYNPYSEWIKNGVSAGTYMEKAGTPIDSNTLLYPFRACANAFDRAATTCASPSFVDSTWTLYMGEKLGYEYPEENKLKGKTVAERAMVIDTLYDCKPVNSSRVRWFARLKTKDTGIGTYYFTIYIGTAKPYLKAGRSTQFHWPRKIDSTAASVVSAHKISLDQAMSTLHFNPNITAAEVAKNKPFEVCISIGPTTLFRDQLKLTREQLYGDASSIVGLQKVEIIRAIDSGGQTTREKMWVVYDVNGSNGTNSTNVFGSCKKA